MRRMGVPSAMTSSQRRQDVAYQGLTRREVLQLAAASGIGSFIGGGARAEAAALSAIGVQLYTVRDLVTKDAAAALKAIAEIGYQEVEVIHATLPTVGPLAKQYGLNAVSMHVDVRLLTGQQPAGGANLASVIGQAQDAGIKYIVMPYIMPGDRPKDAAGFTTLGEALNKAGEQIKKAGLQLCYHNHAFEFTPLADGRRSLDVLLAAADPELLKLELDVFWVSVTGTDPVAVINQYKGRVALMHLKDKMKGAPVSLTESVPPTTFVEVGSGALDFPAILKAASAADVQHYFVEQDQTPGDPLDSLRKSYQYLKNL
jgi:sugar phosphate isomerase/epimerase